MLWSVRWFNAAKCLEKFFAIKKEIFLFLQEMSIAKDDDFKFLSRDTEFLCDFYYRFDKSSKYFKFKTAKDQLDNMSIRQSYWLIT